MAKVTDARTEAEDLKLHPLPPLVAVTDDKYLPTALHVIDEEIAKLNAEINRITEASIDPLLKKIDEYAKERKQKLEAAIKGGHLDDGTWKIERDVIEPNQKVNSTAMRNNYPAEYLTLVELKAKNAMQAGKKLLADETLVDPSDPLGVHRVLRLDITEATLALSKKDLEAVITGKGAPAKIQALLHRPGEYIVTYELKKSEAS